MLMRNKPPLDTEPPPDEGAINLTPLIDVVFVVLILFILIAPLLDLDRIQLAPACAEKKKEMMPIQDRGLIKIQVFADNSIYLNHHLVSQKELLALLKEEKKALPNGIPQLYHDKNACFGTYQGVKNVVEASGFEEMDVILAP
jgi:biopolymer transport protein ExbD